MPVDLLETDVATRLLDRVKQLGLQVSILVNNAGVAAPAAPFLDQDASSVARLFQLNSTVPSLLMHAFAPDMVAAGRGHILNISSGMGCTPGPRWPPTLPRRRCSTACRALSTTSCEAPA